MKVTNKKRLLLFSFIVAETVPCCNQHIIEIVPMTFSVSKFPSKRQSVEMIPRHIKKFVGKNVQAAVLPNV